MSIRILPLVKPLMLDDDGGFMIEYGQSVYYTPRMYFSIAKKALSEWTVASTEWLHLDHPHIAALSAQSGIEDAQFFRRKDAVAALSLLLEEVS